ncbi:hypothetical protein [Alkalicoccobacillus plakortidis]|uniref:Uncharacterized protein n=1 Tax=Alkalicoccobacillus plakortidis TaxID=444060 RepID=A0ABT0XK38_9BACI|nr:hypothetical protein [Alkalicoccobacillus plakortidis]MCM2676256.1 hypothetical protein [Alkalicoccobacillus plakortidis]
MNTKNTIFNLVCISTLALTIYHPSTAAAESIPFPLNKENSYKLDGDHFLPSSLDTITWGHLPNRNSEPVMEITSGETLTVDTVSHEGILDDQGRNPIEYFGEHGVSEDEILEEAKTIAWFRY